MLLVLATGVAPLAGGSQAEAARTASYALRNGLDSTPPLSTGLLTAVSAAPGTSQAWAVGNGVGFMVCSGGYVLGYDGQSWSPVQSGLATDVALNGVAAVSATQVWIVGGVYAKGYCDTRSRPFLADSSGGTFKAYNLTSLHLGDAVLDGISADSSTNAWAVGYSLTKSSASPVALQWSGTSWVQVPIPSQLDSGQELASVSASSASNVWIIGVNPATDVTDLLHWDGTTWASYPNPIAGQSLGDVATSSSNQAWVISFGDASAHWNGTAWTKVAVPKNITLHGVTMSGTSAWAVGRGPVGQSGRAVPKALYSTGGGWQEQTVPDPSASKSSANQSSLYAVSAASGSFVAAVGQNGVECGTGQNSFGDLYNGSVWQSTGGPADLPADRQVGPDCGG
ncbi:MAG TPA: hypothetical protein VGH27_35095 [Streptosporangiaceae bacterium]|jgi:hypothetical protein